MDRGSVEHKISTDRIYRGAVENLLTAKIPRWIKKLSSSYRLDRNFLDGLRISREAIETNSKWLDGSKLR